MYTEIKNYEDACKALGKEPDTLKIEGVSDHRAGILTAINQLIDGSEAFREGWVQDYNDDHQDKWLPWVRLNETEKDPTGFRFYGSVCTHAGTSSVLGPLLCQETEEKSDRFFEVFAEQMKVVIKYLDKKPTN